VLTAKKTRKKKPRVSAARVRGAEKGGYNTQAVCGKRKRSGEGTMEGSGGSVAELCEDREGTSNQTNQ